MNSLCYNTAPSTASIVTNTNDFTAIDWQWNANNGEGRRPLPHFWCDDHLLDVLGAHWMNHLRGDSLSGVSADGCGAVNSNLLLAEVFPPLQAPAIDFESVGADVPICYGTEAPTLELVDPPAEDMEFTWQWEAAGAALSNQATPVLDPVPLDTTTEFQLVATSTDGCGSVASNEILIEVLPSMTPGNLSSSMDTICYGSSSFLISTSPTGADDNFDVLWFYGTGAALNYQPAWPGLEQTLTNSTESFSAYVQYESQYGCGTVSSDTVNVHVYEALQSGILSESQSFCHGDTPNALVTNTTGANGQFSYQWFAGTPPLPLDAETSQTLDPGPLYETTTFMVVATSTIGCGAVTSDAVELSVWDELIAGSLSSENTDTLCFGNSATFNANPEISGNDMFYQWYFGEYIENQPPETLTPIAGENGLALDIDDFNASFWLSLEYISPYGCGSQFAVPVYHHVLPEMQSPSVVLEGGVQDTSICFDAVPPTMIQVSGATGANGEFSYAWEISSTGDAWSPLDFDSDSLQLGELPGSENYIRNVGTNPLCGSIESENLFVLVYDEFVPSSAGTSQSICFGSTPSELQGLGAQGGGEEYTYQWVELTAGDTVEIPDATGPVWSAPELYSDASYMLYSASSVGCGAGFSDIVTLNVADSLCCRFDSDRRPC